MIKPLDFIRQHCICVLFASSMALTGCSSSPSQSEPSPVLSEYHQQLKNEFLDVFYVWKGTPYRLGGSTLKGVDCSAFVQTAFQHAAEINLPRTTEYQVQVGQEIEYGQAKVGDLVFFKTSRTTRHVGVYLGQNQFMHASTSKGVIISRMDNPYWAGNFWQFRRVTTSPVL
ncbi:putative lipoprotein NlpC [Vibrio ichthyoenteri ATCC 700023]|uniref:Putative lipoprotein NlpC n=1 Tax=Vibrio ichthyoenteri ATCC 700023 TaxID=870968 RepID=F9S830_9VIBR|nr:NlpC/P60 family protein [Vibrio ichthyoenteri]EGU30507.1 putative lipoprotein NlpC [Vibrio ichthyoenteri ATCC 700023]